MGRVVLHVLAHVAVECGTIGSDRGMDLARVVRVSARVFQQVRVRVQPCAMVIRALTRALGLALTWVALSGSDLALA